MPAAKAFGGSRKLSPRERSELFVDRRNRRQLLDFAQVDQLEMLTALNAAMAAGATLSFAPAQGGIGVTVRVYRGEYADTEFAGSIEELDELLEIIGSGLAEDGNALRESVRESLKKQGRI